MQTTTTKAAATAPGNAKHSLPQTLRLLAGAVLTGLLLSLCSAAVAGNTTAGVVRATLDNGLQVVTVPTPPAPVSTAVMHYHFGSDEAPAGFPGMAHAQEHMMFRGSPGLTAGQLSAIAAAMGARFNADTYQAVTPHF